MVNDQPDFVKFHLNGVEHKVGSDAKFGAKTALADYIRDVAHLKGTKVMCREGGCGACIVSAKVIDPHTGAEITKSVNSCLTPVLSCNGWQISTVESLGNKHEGYHVVQNRLVNFHGTQCGFCTPGMVMNMYSLLETQKDTIKMADIEQNMDGNICRCTGYRPIMDAFKTLTTDCSEYLQRKCQDIEDCATCPVKRGAGQSACPGRAAAAERVVVKLQSGEEWVTAKTLEKALSEAASAGNAGSVRFVAGYTSTGIYKNEGPFTKFIDINAIPELKKVEVTPAGIKIGGGVTLTALIRLLQENADKTGLEYGRRMATHLERVANVSVRNNGTVAGNLMIKHSHPDFPSDIFVLLTAIGAQITLVSGDGPAKTVPTLEFLKTPMSGKLILSILLPTLANWHFRSFKITRRYQNAHAYVNAALLLKVDKTNGKFVVTEKPRLVYGGISENFIHASKTEETLVGKNLGDPSTLQVAFAALDSEVQPEDVGPLEAAPEYRLQLVKSLLYKTILEIIGGNAAKKLSSGSIDLVRTLTTAKQTFDTDATDVALYKAVPKYEAGIQASGEAEYTGDIPPRPNELYGAFVTSTVACADLVEVDASEALAVPGVVRFLTAKDIPGQNHYMAFNLFPCPIVEPVFALGKVSYHGQSIGLILATSQEVARQATKLVKVKYANEQKPTINFKEAIAKVKEAGTYPAQTTGAFQTKPVDTIEVKHTLQGELYTPAQYHGYMETHSVVVHPREDGVDVYSTTQWMDHVQNTVANVLNLPTNAINVQVRRLGGAFGGKASRHSLVASACAVGAWVTNRPCRVVLDLETNLSMLGIRVPFMMPYEVGFDDQGRIGKLKVDFAGDVGCSPSEGTMFVGIMHVQSAYKAAGWEVAAHFVMTNTPANTFCRSPGGVQAVAGIEWIMDHIAHYLKKDPLEVREINFIEKGDAILMGHPIFDRENYMPQMIAQMKEETDYEARKEAIAKFNAEHRWKKRGIAVLPTRYPVDYFATNLPASVAIYHYDGHVAISHSGIEMGQGLNTKAIQTVAQVLNIPMNRIKVKPNNNFVGANAFLTAGSLGSELTCYAIMRACEQIRENLRPVLEKLENPSWEQLIKEAHAAKVNLTASYTPTAADDIKGYDIWVLNCTEVEIDVLTGEYKVLRTDLYEDTGKSLSPAIDLGQVEGGYIHGQGYWTTEKIVRDEQTGKLLSNGTWTYKLPECKDIPEDFRITLLSKVPNPTGILRSKATGEPSTDAAFAMVLATRNAIAAARKDVGKEDWFEMSFPVTPEDIARLCLVNNSHLSL